MPRIRTIKPEAFQHRKVGRLSHIAFRLWIGMIAHADDEGRLVADPEQLRVLVFGYRDEVKRRHVEATLEEVVSTGLVRLYCHDGTPYADLPSWKDHQRIDRPSASKLPSYQHSTNDRRGLARTLEGSEGIGRDQGSEGIKDPPLPPRVPAAPREGKGFRPMAGLARKGRRGGHDDLADPAFERYYAVYPRHEAKQPARRAWRALNVSTGMAEEIMAALERHCARWRRLHTPSDKIPLPASWLNGRRWTDELAPEPADPYVDFPRVSGVD